MPLWAIVIVGNNALVGGHLSEVWTEDAPIVSAIITGGKEMSSKTYFTYEEIESFVFENEEALQKATIRDLYEFAQDNGFANSGFEFNHFKKALSEIGINYNEMKERK